MFSTSGATKWVETVVDPETGKYYNTYGRTVREYRSKKPWRGVAANGQPSYQVRARSVYVSEC